MLVIFKNWYFMDSRAFPQIHRIVYTLNHLCRGMEFCTLQALMSLPSRTRPSLRPRVFVRCPCGLSGEFQ